VEPRACGEVAQTQRNIRDDSNPLKREICKHPARESRLVVVRGNRAKFNPGESLVIFVGEDCENAHEMERLMGNLASHSNFGLASKMSKSAKNPVPEYIDDQAFEK
jgi:hypothetical protein